MNECIWPPFFFLATGPVAATYSKIARPPDVAMILLTSRLLSCAVTEENRIIISTESISALSPIKAERNLAPNGLNSN